MRILNSTPKKALTAGGALTMLVGGATMAAPATPAFASAFECTFAPGGPGANQCMNVWGNGQVIKSISENYSTGALPGDNVCRYQAKWRGDSVSAGWVTQYSPYHSSCSFHAALTGHRKLHFAKMQANTSFYGYWKSSNTGGWTNPVEIKIK